MFRVRGDKGDKEAQGLLSFRGRGHRADKGAQKRTGEGKLFSYIALKPIFCILLAGSVRTPKLFSKSSQQKPGIFKEKLI